MGYLNPHTHKLDGQPTVVVICGSTRFRVEMAEANRWLTMGGHIVLAPGVFGHDGDEITDAQKAALDGLHLRKIDMADEVLVVSDATGYYGASTEREIAYAEEHGKPVRFAVHARRSPGGGGSQ